MYLKEIIYSTYFGIQMGNSFADGHLAPPKEGQASMWCFRKAEDRVYTPNPVVLVRHFKAMYVYWVEKLEYKFIIRQHEYEHNMPL